MYLTLFRFIFVVDFIGSVLRIYGNETDNVFFAKPDKFMYALNDTTYGIHGSVIGVIGVL